MNKCWLAAFVSLGAIACAGTSPRAEPGSTGPAATAPATPGDAPLTVVEVPTPEEQTETSEAPPVVEVSSADGWVTFHGNSARTGVSEAAAIRRPAIRWKAKVGIQSWLNSPLAVGSSLVIVPSCGNAHNKPDPGDGVVALDLATGRKLWHAHFDQDANGATATRERVFATSDDGHLYALEIKTGKVAWKRQGKGKMYTHPLLFGSAVVVGDATGYVRAFAASDGKELWSVQLTGAIRGGAASDGKHIYVASQGGEVAALTRAGRVKWRKIVDRPPWSGRGRNEPIEVYSSPVLSADSVILMFARDTYYKDVPAILSLNKRTGKLRWRAKGPGSWGNIRSTPALSGGVLVYGEPYSGDIVGIKAASGRSAYRKTIGKCYFPQWSSPAVAGNVAYLPRFDGSVYAVKASNGKVLWDIYLGDSRHAGRKAPPAPPSRYGCEWDVPNGYPLYAPAAIASDGTLLAGSGEGYLYAIENR